MPTDPNSGSTGNPEPVEELAEETREENPDPTTARESFELELMEEGRSEEGEDVELNEGLDE
jgi:hypothetical protein